MKEKNACILYGTEKKNQQQNRTVERSRCVMKAQSTKKSSAKNAITTNPFSIVLPRVKRIEPEP